MCARVLGAGGPPPSPRRASPTGFHSQETGILSTLNGRHLKMGGFPLSLSFLLIVGIWERRKQIFIFLIINLLFLVLLHLYNYTLTGTCMKYSLQSEQEIGTKSLRAPGLHTHGPHLPEVLFPSGPPLPSQGRLFPWATPQRFRPSPLPPRYRAISPSSSNLLGLPDALHA